MTSLFKQLPHDIIGHIYEYDNTYREIFSKTVIPDIRKHSWQKCIKECTYYCCYDEISKRIEFSALIHDEISKKMEFALDHFVEENKDRHFPEDVTIIVTDFHRFTNIRFVRIDNSVVVYRILTTEQSLIYESDMETYKTYNIRSTKISSNRQFILNQIVI